MAAEERIYTVPLSKAYSTVRTKRARKAISILKLFTARHMKVDVDNVKISSGVNSLIWKRGIQKPPRKIKVKMVKEENDGNPIVKVMLLDETWKVIKIHYPEEEQPSSTKEEAKTEKEEQEKKDTSKETKEKKGKGKENKEENTDKVKVKQSKDNKSKGNKEKEKGEKDDKTSKG